MLFRSCNGGFAVGAGHPYQGELPAGVAVPLRGQAAQCVGRVGHTDKADMTRDEMAKFINMQLSERAAWEIETTAATGSGDKQACFSSGSQLLYVMWPDEAVVSDISRRMKKVEGENEG